MSRKDNTIIRATCCLYYWLCYLEKATDNEGVFAESTLKYPFVESLERHNHTNVILENKHPNFSNRRIDVTICNDGKNAEDHNNIYVEFKYVREDANTSEEKQRYFNDLMRLWILHKNNSSRECYFIACGPTDVFNRKLKGKERKSLPGTIKEAQVNVRRNNSTKSVYKEWLSFAKKENRKEVVPLPKYVDSFNKDYETNYSCEEITLVTELELLLPNDNNDDYSYSVGLWRVSSR